MLCFFILYSHRLRTLKRGWDKTHLRSSKALKILLFVNFQGFFATSSSLFSASADAFLGARVEPVVSPTRLSPRSRRFRYEQLVFPSIFSKYQNYSKHPKVRLIMSQSLFTISFPHLPVGAETGDCAFLDV